MHPASISSLVVAFHDSPWSANTPDSWVIFWLFILIQLSARHLFVMRFPTALHLTHRCECSCRSPPSTLASSGRPSEHPSFMSELRCRNRNNYRLMEQHHSNRDEAKWSPFLCFANVTAGDPVASQVYLAARVPVGYISRFFLWMTVLKHQSDFKSVHAKLGLWVSRRSHWQ